MATPVIGQPPEIRRAATIIGFWGALAIGEVALSFNGTLDFRAQVRPILTGLTALYVAWGLMNLKGWAWWMSMLVIGWRVILGSLAFMVLGVLTVMNPDAASNVLAREGFALRMVEAAVSFITLGYATFLLWRPATRAHFRNAPRWGMGKRVQGGDGATESES